MKVVWAWCKKCMSRQDHELRPNGLAKCTRCGTTKTIPVKIK